jgi:assimilatory nitrate reductase catalytic subunit
VRGDPDHPANFGRLCTKGSTLHLTATPHRAAARCALLQPLQRAARGAAAARWAGTRARRTAGRPLRRASTQHGPDAVGLYLSGQLLTEDYYVFNKLAKGLIGTNNVDTNSRLCMSSAVAGYKQSLGADAPPCLLRRHRAGRRRLHHRRQHGLGAPGAVPPAGGRAPRQPGAALIVVDPRRTETAEAGRPAPAAAARHRRGAAPRLLHVMLWEGWVDTAFIAAHTSGFEALRDRVRDFTPAAPPRVCGCRADIVQAARWFAHGPGRALVAVLPGPEPEQQRHRQEHHADQPAPGHGQIGKPGAGPFSLTGQPNAMGGREVGGLANLLPAHRDLANPAHRAEVARCGA